MTLSRDQVLEKLKEYPNLLRLCMTDGALPVYGHTLDGLVNELLRLVSAYEGRLEKANRNYDDVLIGLTYKDSDIGQLKAQLREAEANGLERALAIYDEYVLAPVNDDDSFEGRCRAEAARIREGKS